jgi:hypothetical protein
MRPQGVYCAMDRCHVGFKFLRLNETPNGQELKGGGIALAGDHPDSCQNDILGSKQNHMNQNFSELDCSSMWADLTAKI